MGKVGRHHSHPHGWIGSEIGGSQVDRSEIDHRRLRRNVVLVVVSTFVTVRTIEMESPASRIVPDSWDDPSRYSRKISRRM